MQCHILLDITLYGYFEKALLEKLLSKIASKYDIYVSILIETIAVTCKLNNCKKLSVDYRQSLLCRRRVKKARPQIVIFVSSINPQSYIYTQTSSEKEPSYPLSTRIMKLPFVSLTFHFLLVH